MSTTAKITLSGPLQQWAEAQATLGGFDTVDEFVGQVLREERKRQSLEALELKLLDAVQSGPATPMSQNEWKALKTLARRGPQGASRHALKR